jgi:hypothetical protein
MFLLHDDYNGRIYGIFTTAEGAKAFVSDALGIDVEWSDPKHTVTGSMLSRPRGKNNFHIKPVPVDPKEFTNLPLGF